MTELSRDSINTSTRSGNQMNKQCSSVHPSSKRIRGPRRKRVATSMRRLRSFPQKHGHSLALGDTPHSGTQGYISHADLLDLATKRRCQGIMTEPVPHLCRPEKNFWVFKATVYKSAKCRGFVGYGDAHPGNVSPLIFNHAEMRMAETRAVNRALRKAYGIALCSLEELPPWTLTQEQIPQLRRTLQSQSPFPKGATHANQDSRPQSHPRKAAPGRRVVSGPDGPLRARRARR